MVVSRRYGSIATGGRARRIHKTAGGDEFYDMVRETRSIYGTEEEYRERERILRRKI